LAILVGLIENGVNPEALAAVVKELKRETQALRVIFKTQQIFQFFIYRPKKK
jgi:tRNA(Ile2) C34 agmatinyltransferase TiaS